MPGSLYKKKTLAQVFSFEFCEISKNTFYYCRTPLVAAYVLNGYRKGTLACNGVI